MLSKYDEYPVHQASRPFAHIPSTDYSWDEGYYFGMFNAEEKIYLTTGIRVNPNADMIGGYVVLIVNGRHYTVRVSRCWRRQLDTVIGPLSYEFVEPMKTIRLKLDANDSALSFDITWTGIIPAFEEDHHVAETRGRVTTDQTRYAQTGVASGWIEFEGKRIEVTPDKWMGDRDHSWGLYADRKPLGGHVEWLPPKKQEGVPRALHIWTLFKAGDWSGFYHLHESPSGKKEKMNDVFATPFEGRMYRNWDQEVVHLVDGRHEMRFQPGTRIFTGGTIYLTDDKGGQWTQHFEVTCPPWVPQTTGYNAGSWKDGGSFHTYHGNEELALEWDDFDWSVQPFDHTPYQPKHGSLSKEQAMGSFNLVTGSQLHGVEFLVRTEIIDPQGRSHKGQGHFENFVFGRFDPYGFK